MSGAGVQEIRTEKKLWDTLWKQRNMILGALIGVGCFLTIYGVNILDPSYDAWILVSEGDLTQHYQGWQFFRQDKWRFPFGLFGNLSYPIEASIIFMDSIPLFAVLFKVLSPILPDTFQYFGIWSLLCYTLQGALSAKILEKYLKSTIAVCAGTVFFCIPAFMLMRLHMHTSLSSQWLILLGLSTLVYFEEYFKGIKKGALTWALIGVLCSSIHLYFLCMCGIILFGFICRDFIETRKIKRSVILLLSFVVSAAVTVYLLGGFSCGSSAAGNGLGNYSFNLNGFYNARGWSVLLPSYGTANGGQVEGFAYLGAGILFMIPVSVAIWFVANLKKMKDVNWWKESALIALPWAIIFGISVVAALSPVITIDDKILFTIPLPNIAEKLWSIFRATGRLVWPAAYVLMLLAVCCGFRYVKRWIAAICILVFMLLQVYDLHDSLESKRSGYQRTVEYQNPLDSPVWQAIAESGRIKHLMLVDMYTVSAETMYRLADYTYRNGMDQNYYHYAHSLGEGPTLAWIELMSNLQDDTMYISDFSTKLRCSQYDLHYYEANGYIVGLTWPLQGFEELNIEELSTMTIDYKNNQWLSGGEDVDGVRYIHKDGISFGPYISIPNGTFKVIISGENLEGGNYACTADSGAVRLSVEYLTVTDNEVSFYLDLSEGISTFELVMRNLGDEDMVIKNVSIRGERYGQ